MGFEQTPGFTAGSQDFYDCENISCGPRMESAELLRIWMGLPAR
jgi:hypothetical protein